MFDDLVWWARQFMTSKRPPREPMRAYVAGRQLRRLLTAAVILFAIPAAAVAETFDAVYRATLAGIPIGKARLTGSIGAVAYTMRLKGEDPGIFEPLRCLLQRDLTRCAADALELPALDGRPIRAGHSGELHGRPCQAHLD